MKLTGERLRSYLNFQIEMINRNWKNGLISIEPIYKIQKLSIEKRSYTKFNNFSTKLGRNDYFQHNFKIQNVESLEVWESIFMMKYSLKKKGLFSSKYQDVFVIQDSTEQLSESELEMKMKANSKTFDTYRLAYWDNDESVTVLYLNCESMIVSFAENFTFEV